MRKPTTKSLAVNGPVNIMFCGSAPLPDLLWKNGPCETDHIHTHHNKHYGQDLNAPTSMGAWADGANNATALPNAMSLEDGAATTFHEFIKALKECTENSCDVYFNIHTEYSFYYNPGAFGIARAQLRPVTCPSGVNSNYDTMCFGTNGEVNSMNTNQVMGLPNQLPDDAALVMPLMEADVLVMYTPPQEGGYGNYLRG